MFLLFSYYMYYPAGGWQDFKGKFATIEEARKHAEGDFYDIVQLDTLELVEHGTI